jgi:hypothetical protein
VRTVLNSISLFDTEQLMNLQRNSCLDGTMDWALLVFFLAFFGEVMPLSVLYWMQIVVSNMEIERK